MTDTSAKFELKPLTPEDLSAVVIIDMATSGESRRGYFEKRLQSAIDRPQDYVFVGVSVENRLAGYAFAKLTSGAFGQTEASASLDAIGVDPNLAQMGLGHALVGEVEAVLRRKKVATVTSQIDWLQQSVLRFMAHAGFSLAPRVVLSRPTDEVVMQLDEESDADMEEVDFSSPLGDEANALSHDKVPVRTMKDSDLAKIISIDADYSGVERSDYYARKQHENLHQSGVQVSLVAEQDSFPVGFIMARVDFGEFGHTSTEAVLDTIAVAPGFDGQGIGRALFSKLMANLGILQADTVRTEVNWDDTGLINFFSAVGFKHAQRVALIKAL